MKNEVKAVSVKKQPPVYQRRVGIYSGTFDPVHAGHIAFALQAVTEARLDQLYFLPERRPRGKSGVTHYAHRVAMIRRAVKPHPQLELLETVDKNFSVHSTLPRLQAQFRGAQLVFVCGSDVARQIAAWKGADTFIAAVELCVGIRGNASPQNGSDEALGLPDSSLRITVLQSIYPAMSSSAIRQSIRSGRSVRGLLQSVRVYASREWLYV